MTIKELIPILNSMDEDTILSLCGRDIFYMYDMKHIRDISGKSILLLDVENEDYFIDEIKNNEIIPIELKKV